MSTESPGQPLVTVSGGYVHVARRNPVSEISLAVDTTEGVDAAEEVAAFLRGALADAYHTGRSDAASEPSEPMPVEHDATVSFAIDDHLWMSCSCGWEKRFKSHAEVADLVAAEEEHLAEVGTR